PRLPDGMLPAQQEVIILISRIHRIGCFTSIVREGVFTAARRYSMRCLSLHGKNSDIKHMHAPVGHQSTAILPEPAPGKMEMVSYRMDVLEPVPATYRNLP